MATTTKKKAGNKAGAKKARSKKAPTAAKLPKADQPGDDPKAQKPQPLPRGQERLPDGSIRLKTGDWDLPNTKQEFDVHGAKLQLGGKVLIAGKNVNWLAIVKCQKCGTPRELGVIVTEVGDHTVVTYNCQNDTDCQIGGGRLYVAVYDKAQLTINAK